MQRERFASDLALALESIPRLNHAIQLAAEAGDGASRRRLQQELIAAEERVDWLEAQLYLIKELGLDNYLAAARADAGPE